MIFLANSMVCIHNLMQWRKFMVEVSVAGWVVRKMCRDRIPIACQEKNIN